MTEVPGRLINTGRTFWQNRSWNKPRGARAMKARVRKSLSQRIRRLETGRGGEWNTHDVVGSPGNIDTSGIIQPLTNIGQGDQSVNRTGLVIKLQNVQLKMRLKTHSAESTGTVVRVILFFDTRCDGVQPTVTDVLESASYLQFREHDEKGRFQFVCDKYIELQPIINAQSAVRTVKFFKNFGGRKCEYRGTGSTVTNWGKGQLFILLIGDLGSNGPLVDYVSRIRFTDQ